MSCYDPEDEEAMQNILEQECAWADVIVIGPGLGQESYTEYLLETVLSDAYVPVVLDADGLNCVAAHPYLTRYFTENIIITPHMGEMSRLTSVPIVDLKKDPLGEARAYSARYGTVCVLKDAVTVVTDKDGAAWINQSGCSAMAKGGSGDVLTGVIAGLLAAAWNAQRQQPSVCMCMGVPDSMRQQRMERTVCWPQMWQTAF